jgi:hypothetical protein
MSTPTRDESWELVTSLTQSLTLQIGRAHV